MTAQDATAALSQSHQKANNIKKMGWFKYHLILLLSDWLVRLMYFTYRFEYLDIHLRAKAEAKHPSGSKILACWHENCFGAIMGHSGQSISLLISQSFDGDLTAYVGKKLGYQTIRGSSTRGGKDAREEYLRQVPEGVGLALAVDGPKGPRHKVKPGCVDLPAQAGIAVLPLTSYAKRSFVLSKSWDQMRIPKPFAKIYIAYGEPVVFAKGINGEAFTQAQEGLAEVLLELDRKTISRVERL